MYSGKLSLNLIQSLKSNYLINVITSDSIPKYAEFSSDLKEEIALSTVSQGFIFEETVNISACSLYFLAVYNVG